MPKRFDYTQLHRELKTYLATSGPVSSEEICRYLKISQATFSRILSGLLDSMVIRGCARATRYAAKREIPGIESPIPLYEIDRNGKTIRLGLVNPILPEGFCVEWHHVKGINSSYSDLPYFLEDMRPLGFLGRLIPQHYPDLRAPEDIRHWSANDILRFLTRYGWNMVGNLILGNQALQYYLDQNHQAASMRITSGSKINLYEEMAENVLLTGPAGSSAAGEQPKFLATVAPNRAVLVKFSPPIKDRVSRRVSDLLLCEYLAHTVLLKFGFSAANSVLIKGKKRLFLETTRFDRTPKGRLGVLSLHVLNLEFSGSGQDWSSASLGLWKRGIISKEMYQQIVAIDLFGSLIANTDRHLGNFSFYTHNLKVIGLAPVYDMLPMLYTPQQGQILARPLLHITPKVEHAGLWQKPWKAALYFWEKVETHPDITSEFRKISRDNSKHVKNLEELFLKLPE